MPGEMDATMRLLQAVCYPGDGVLLRGLSVVHVSAAPAMREVLVAIGMEPRLEPAVTIPCGDRLACIAKDGVHTLVVAVPASMDVRAVHAKMKKALALFSRAVDLSWTPSGRGGDGSSGAPAELFVGRVRPRPS